MAGSEYYDDRNCDYCGAWYSVDEHHSCEELKNIIAKNKSIQSLQDKINTKISYSKALDMYSSGLRAEDIIDVGFRLKAGWVSKYG